MSTRKELRDVYQETTDRIIAALEAGAAPWRCDWIASGGEPLRANGQPYRGVNVLLLAMSAMGNGYGNPHWMTYRQAQALGGQVRKGEKSTPIVFYKTYQKDAADDPRADEDGKVKLAVLRGYSVFNVEQIDGLQADKFAPEAAQLIAGKQRDEQAEAALRSCGATINEGGTRACYIPGQDVVCLPNFERFHTVPGYLATMAHELAHWTGAKHRLDRAKAARFGDADYAREELIAEIAAGFMGARLGFFGDHIESHAGYLDHWLTILRGDKRAIFKAAAAAQLAADYVLGARAEQSTDEEA